MSKFVKDLITNDLRTRLQGVEDALLVDVIGLENNKNVALRQRLRKKNIQLLVVKNSLAIAFSDYSLATGAMEPVGFDNFDRLLAQGKGCLLLGSHLGSFDLMMLAHRAMDGRPISILMRIDPRARLRRIAGIEESGPSVIQTGRPEQLERFPGRRHGCHARTDLRQQQRRQRAPVVPAQALALVEMGILQIHRRQRQRLSGALRRFDVERGISDQYRFRDIHLLERGTPDELVVVLDEPAVAELLREGRDLRRQPHQRHHRLQRLHQ